MHRTGALLLSCGLLSSTAACRSTIDDYSGIFSQPPHQLNKAQGSGDYFDGNFLGGDQYINPANLSAMQSTLQRCMTPEIRESVNGLLSEIRMNNPDAVRSMFGGDHGAKMGVMAFGVGENEKGKKVARAAKYEYNEKGESISKDFFEQQLEEDDVQLPKETVEDYSTEDAIEVEFVEGQIESETSEKMNRE